MKKFLCGVLALLVCTSAAGCTKNGDDVQTVTCLAETEPAVLETVQPDYTAEEISGYFEYALLKEITDGRNTVASPLSVKLAMNMAALGAEGDTENELLTLFGYESSEQMREESKSIMAELDRADGSITVNNSVWIDSSFENVAESFTNGLGDVFNAEAFREKLADKKIVKKLNGWIDKKTKGLIPNMIGEPFKEDTKMLLVNALYFKNEWVYEFDPHYKGSTMTFHGANGDCEAIGMYLKRDSIKYAENDFFRSVSLDYKDGSYMNIYLPEMVDESVLDIIEKQSPTELAAAMDMEYREEKVYITMPRFECDYGSSLKEILQKMGLFYTFSENGFADFGGMVTENAEEQLYISDVIHAAKILCNEKGTEATAATVAVEGDGAAIEDPPIIFIVDRPFIYELKSPSGETLFIGTICGF